MAELIATVASELSAMLFTYYFDAISKMKKTLIASLLALIFSSDVYAEDKPDSTAAPPTFLGMDLIDSQPQNNVWIDSGFYSYHWDRDKNLNPDNYGLGVEYQFSTVNSVTAGRFYNSNRDYSNYVGVYYQPLVLGPFHLGAVAGGFDGYPHVRQGGWFLAAIPVASAEWDRFGLNLAFVPSIGTRLYGSISLQLKVKIWD